MTHTSHVTAENEKKTKQPGISPYILAKRVLQLKIKHIIPVVQQQHACQNDTPLPR
jgi:hypothetical protein